MTITLANGQTTEIDYSDFFKVRHHKWHIVAKRYVGSRRNGHVIYLHRLIMDAPKGMVVDHVNGDTFDNRRSNLRIVSHRKNIANRTKLNRNNTSGFAGVCWNKQSQSWMAYTAIGGKHKTIGLFKSKEEAVVARANFSNKEAL